MFTKTFACISYCICSGFAVSQVKDSFRLYYMNTGSLNNGIAITTFIARSKLDCILKCQRQNMTCMTFYYQQSSRLCQHNMDIHVYRQPLPTVTTPTPDDWAYGEMEWIRGSEYLEPCTQSLDCTEPNSECRYSACLCIPGYSHSDQARKCQIGCNDEGYGTWYQYTHYYYLSGYDVATYTGVATSVDCLTLCASANFVCRSTEWNDVTFECHISNITKLEVPESAWIYDIHWIYSNRNCAL
ncbi:hypothetical protein CHS0354_022452 [Potamilus streckersoni]|uniref:Apple domain-containing protein n=1 Tax=Potamilus streckersoni TaxID=2493646 RepID=A0AAE0W4F4_9BIVA|nr:hypothetical protein CHS0354_022452 [Potamilus streckersoni]